jgi:predicted metalloenzyme YecM
MQPDGPAHEQLILLSQQRLHHLFHRKQMFRAMAEIMVLQLLVLAAEHRAIRIRGHQAAEQRHQLPEELSVHIHALLQI